MDKSSLAELRKIIDDIDSQIVVLLNERARTALEIGKAKTKLGKEAYDPSRERSVLGKIEKLNHGPLPKGSIDEIYTAIITGGSDSPK
jgi:chorismate mutase-like protein